MFQAWRLPDSAHLALIPVAWRSLLNSTSLIQARSADKIGDAMDANLYEAPNSSTSAAELRGTRPLRSAFIRGATLGLASGAPCGVLLMGLIRFMVAVSIPDVGQIGRSDFINKLTAFNGHHRTLERSPRFYDLRDTDRQQCERLLADYVQRLKAKKRDPNSYDIEDVCGRVAGNGSLGRLRYAVLLVGEGSEAAKNVMLEIKEALPSAYDEAHSRRCAGPRRYVTSSLICHRRKIGCSTGTGASA